MVWRHEKSPLPQDHLHSHRSWGKQIKICQYFELPSGMTLQLWPPVYVSVMYKWLKVIITFYLLSQPPCFPLRLQEGQHITLSNRAFDITDDRSVAIIHEFDPHLQHTYKNINFSRTANRIWNRIWVTKTIILFQSYLSTLSLGTSSSQNLGYLRWLETYFYHINSALIHKKTELWP